MLFEYDVGVELRHLRYFAAVAELRNVTRAAVRLRVAQPALSRQIQDLEEELGVKLLERSTRGIKLTEAGKFFGNEAGAVLARADQALKAVRALARGETGELRVGYAPSPTTEILPRALAAFEKASPGVRVTLLDLTSDDLESALLDGRVHVSVMVKPGSRPQSGILFEEIVRYALRVAVAREHRFARMTKVPLRRLLAESLAAYARAEYAEYHEMLESIFATLDLSRRLQWSAMVPRRVTPDRQRRDPCQVFRLTGSPCVLPNRNSAQSIGCRVDKSLRSRALTSGTSPPRRRVPNALPRMICQASGRYSTQGRPPH